MEKEIKYIRNNNWKYHIKIKDQFDTEDNNNPDKISKMCSLIIKQLSDLREQVNNSNIIEEEIDDIDMALEELIDHFGFVNEFCTGEIKKEEWSDFDFNGKYNDLFNDYLYELYNLADTRVRCYLIIKDVKIPDVIIIEKFLWVG